MKKRESTTSLGDHQSQHVVPHAATFRSLDDPTGGDAEKALENSRRKREFDKNYVSPKTRLRNRLGNYPAFKQSRPDFINMLLADATEELSANEVLKLEANEVVFSVGQTCGFGNTPFYVVIDGGMIVQNRLEVVLGTLQEGEMFGEGGAVGLTEERTATVRASDMPCSVLRIEGPALEAALVAYPEERDHIEETFYKRQTKNQDFEKSREQWVAKVVVPALEGTALFGGCPDELLYDIAGPLTECTYKDGQVICWCGERADSMLLLLEGNVEVEAKSGSKISLAGAGATFGEVVALNIFPYRTATIRATGRARVLSVTAKAVTNAIRNSPEPLVQRAFARLADSRHEQVQKGLPMSALAINARPDDICVRAVALQSERVELQPGQAWIPVSDSDACGPHFGVLVKGKAALETSEEQRLVCMLGPGSLIPEGLCSEYRSHVRAITPCEGYRVRQNDFLVAVYSMPSAQEWFYRFRLMDRRNRAHLSQRLSAARGVTEGVMHQPSDDDIHMWKTRRQRAVEKAKVIKGQASGHCSSNATSKLPLSIPSSAHSFLESPSGRMWRNDTRLTPSDRQAIAMNRADSAPQLSVMTAGSDMSDSMNSVRLPRLQTAS